MITIEFDSASGQHIATQQNTIDLITHRFVLFEAKPIGPISVYKYHEERGWVELPEGTYFRKPNRLVIFPDALVPDSVGDFPNIQLVYPVAAPETQPEPEAQPAPPETETPPDAPSPIGA